MKYLFMNLMDGFKILKHSKGGKFEDMLRTVWNEYGVIQWITEDFMEFAIILALAIILDFILLSLFNEGGD